MTQTKPTDEPMYEEISGQSKPRITIISNGLPRHGKTTFALTAPAPIAVLSFDINTKAICEKVHAATGKKILYTSFLDRPNPDNPVAGQDFKDFLNIYKAHWGKFTKHYYKTLKMPEVKSIVIDTGTRMYEDARFAYLGRARPDELSQVNKEGANTGVKVSIDKIMSKEYADVKDAIRDMISSCQDKNLIITHLSKEEWSNNAKSGKYIMDGMVGMGYYGQVEAYHWRDPISGLFWTRLINSTGNGEIRGRAGSYQYTANGNSYVPGEDEVEGELNNFAMVAQLTYPNTNPEDWE